MTRNTSEEALRRIREETEYRLDYYARHPERIGRRLRQLDAEWDIERCLETGSASLTIVGLVLGATRSKKWLLLSGVVQGFFLQHALQGWCPPLPVLRSFGVRTVEEIAEERYALRAIRGDFEGVSTSAAVMADCAVEWKDISV